MTHSKSLLDSLMGGMADLTRRPPVAGRGPQAKRTIAPDVLCVLTSGHTRRLLGSGGRACGAALIGGLAYRAHCLWQGTRGAAALPKPAFEVDDDLAERLLQAMVAAARADGHVTRAERTAIEGKLARMGIAAEMQALIAAELDSPLDAGRIAGLARTEAEAVEIYAASLLVLDAAGPAEALYLTTLAERLGLEPALVAQVHGQAAGGPAAGGFAAGGPAAVGPAPGGPVPGV